MITEAQVRDGVTERAKRLAIRSRIFDVQLVEEWQVDQGAARIDMAFIGESLIGVEIKGPNDNLSRLQSQSHHYRRYFDFLILVVAEKFADDAIGLLPPHWGVVTISSRSGSIQFRQLRRAAPNPEAATEHFLEFLWKDELVALAGRHIPNELTSRATRPKIRRTLLEHVPDDLLRRECRNALLQRPSWRAVELQH